VFLLSSFAPLCQGADLSSASRGSNESENQDAGVALTIFFLFFPLSSH